MEPIVPDLPPGLLRGREIDPRLVPDVFTGQPAS